MVVGEYSSVIRHLQHLCRHHRIFFNIFYAFAEINETKFSAGLLPHIIMEHREHQLHTRCVWLGNDVMHLQNSLSINCMNTISRIYRMKMLRRSCTISWPLFSSSFSETRIRKSQLLLTTERLGFKYPGNYLHLSELTVKFAFCIPAFYIHLANITGGRCSEDRIGLFGQVFICRMVARQIAN